MKRIITLLIFLLITVSFLPALEVDSTELQSAGKDVNFINYTGKQNVYTIETMKGIGRTMAMDLKKGKAIGRYYYAFSALHAVGAAAPGKFDADIIIMSKYAKIYHINSIRLILAGFLEEYYGYSAGDAGTLAFFVTIYNAVKRGNMGFFEQKYKDVVLRNITQRNAGIDLNYKNWPGATNMLIPLTGEAKFKEMSSLDTTEISSKEVVETLRKEEDKGIEERKDLVEVKEKEVEQDKEEVKEEEKKIEEKKDEIKEEEKKIEEKKDEIKEEEKKIEEKKDEIKEEEKKIEEKKEELETITDPEEKKQAEEEIKEEEKKVEEKKEEVKEEETKVEEKKEEVKEEETKVEEKKEEVKEEEAKVEEKKEVIEKKEEEIAEDKKEIAKDERIEEIKQDPEKAAEELADQEERLKAAEEELKAQQTDEKVALGKFYYLKVDEYLTDGHYNNVLYIIDAASGKILVKSPEVNISGQKYDLTTDGVVVITHKGKGSEHTYLSLMDLDTLETKITSEDTVFHRSFVEYRGGFIYILAHIGTEYYLGKYNLKLERVAKSNETIYKNSFITFFGDRIYITSNDREILALNKDDLSLIEKIIPD